MGEREFRENLRKEGKRRNRKQVQEKGMGRREGRCSGLSNIF